MGALVQKAVTAGVGGVTLAERAKYPYIKEEEGRDRRQIPTPKKLSGKKNLKLSGIYAEGDGGTLLV